MTKLTTELLKRASKLARKQSDMSALLTAAFEHRYGVTYSEADCDWLIDDLDYGQGGGGITLAEADAHMTKAGYPPKAIGSKNQCS